MIVRSEGVTKVKQFRDYSALRRLYVPSVGRCWGAWQEDVAPLFDLLELFAFMGGAYRDGHTGDEMS